MGCWFKSYGEQQFMFCHNHDSISIANSWLCGIAQRNHKTTAPVGICHKGINCKPQMGRSKWFDYKGIESRYEVFESRYEGFEQCLNHGMKQSWIQFTCLFTIQMECQIKTGTKKSTPPLIHNLFV